jgi:hypothetical protein
MPRFDWNMINNVNHNNGIYIVFENGEVFKKMDRIVRVGTHTSGGRLKARLKNHFISENKDGSIFRKNIGKAILNKNHDKYLNIWSKNSSKKSLMQYVQGFNSEYQKQIEKLISNYMRENLSFTCFPVSSVEERLRLEEGIIASLYNAPDFIASNEWLGNFSPEKLIMQSGMWLKRGLNGISLSGQEFEKIDRYCSINNASESDEVS